MTHTKTPHKHAVEIHAFAEGSEIQYQNEDNKLWYDIKNPSFLENVDYRVKSPQVMAWYRVAEMRTKGAPHVYTVNAQNDMQEYSMPTGECFIRWLTDRIEYEVTQ